MDIGKAYTFIYNDEGWVSKILIAGLCTFFSWLILPLFLLAGYQLLVMKNVADGDTDSLPVWTDIGDMFMDGLKVTVATWIYFLPIIFLSCLGGAISALLSGAADPDLAAGVSIMWGIIGCLMIPISLLLALFVPSIFIQYGRTKDFGALFRFGEVWSITQENLTDIVLVLLAAAGASLVLGLVFGLLIWTICIPLLIIFLGNAWIAIASSHLYGQIWAKMEGKAVEVAMPG